MITVTHRDNLRLPGSPTALYEGRDHGAGVSLFWVDSPAETVHRFRSCGTGNLQMLCIHASPAIIQEFVESPSPA